MNDTFQLFMGFLTPIATMLSSLMLGLLMMTGTSAWIAVTGSVVGMIHLFSAARLRAGLQEAESMDDTCGNSPLASHAKEGGN